MQNEYGDYLQISIIIAVMIIIFLLYLISKYKKQIKYKNEKIEHLNLLYEEDKTHSKTKLKEAQDKITELINNISQLEKNAQEGTKNQVVMQIEIQQKKRTRELRRAGLEEVEL